LAKCGFSYASRLVEQGDYFGHCYLARKFFHILSHDGNNVILTAQKV
jgi:hypothetical protein